MVHTRLFKAYFWLWAALATGAATCGTDTGGRSVTGETGAWDKVDSLDTRAFREAWRRPSMIDHVRTVRIEEVGDAGAVTAFHEITVRFTADDSATAIIRADSSGAIGFGLFEGLADGTSGVPDLVDPTGYVLAEDASFLSARNREKYEVIDLPDSVAQWGSIHRLAIEAVSGSGDREVVRGVRYETRGEGGPLVSVDLRREDRALLFTERSRASATTRPDGEGGLLPVTSTYETWILPRFGRHRRFRITSAWSYPSR